jgi:flagellar export protein FliJ
MSSFIFRLERVLQLRSRAERERARALSEAMRAEQASRASLEEAEALLDRCADQIADGAGSIANAGSLTNLGLTVEAAAQQVEAAEGTHRRASDAVETEQQRFGQARQERRVVERLREHRQEAWQQEESRKEQKELDGLSHHRRHAENGKP